MDIKDAREAAREVAKKEKQKEAISKKAKASKNNKNITEFFKRSWGGMNPQIN